MLYLDLLHPLLAILPHCKHNSSAALGQQKSRGVDKTEVSIWYDIVSVLSLSLSGILNTCLNVMLVQTVYILLFTSVTHISIRNTASWFITFALFLLVSVGIYFGRYIRFNSWDILHPARFIGKLLGHFRAKGVRLNCLLFILFHSLFFTLFYCVTMANVLEPFIVFLTT